MLKKHWDRVLNSPGAEYQVNHFDAFVMEFYFQEMLAPVVLFGMLFRRLRLGGT